jgi:uncharacterized protein YbjT (DUF2867 family)
MILITGGTGNSGGEIVRQLGGTGQRFRMLVRDPKKVQATKPASAELVVGDLGKPETLGPALKGIDVALLLSGPTPDQLQHELNFVEAAERAGLPRIVKFSAMTAGPKAAARWPRTHGTIEERIKATKIAWTFLRPTFFAQNLLGLADMVKQGTIYQPAGNGKSACVDIRDIASVAVQTLLKPGHEGNAYELNGGESIDYHQIASFFTKALGRKITYQDIPPAAAQQAMEQAGIPRFNAEGINELMTQLRNGDYDKVSGDIRTVTGRYPLPLQQFIEENLAAFGGSGSV